MQLVNPLEQQNAVKTLYSEFVSPVCAKYGFTRIELDILLFLANNTRYDTATDIVEVRFLAKSQVSAAIKNLEARGCLRREYQLENRKTAHLRLCDPPQPMIAAGRRSKQSQTSWESRSSGSLPVPKVSTRMETGWATPMA